MKKFKVRIKKAPQMNMGGYIPMYQAGTANTEEQLPTLNEPGYFGEAPLPVAAPVAGAPIPIAVDSVRQDSIPVVPRDTVVTKTPAGTVKKKPAKQPLYIDPNNTDSGSQLDYALPMIAGAGALYGAYKLGQMGSPAADAAKKAASMFIDPNAIITPFNQRQYLQIPSREMKNTAQYQKNVAEGKKIVDQITKVGKYTREEVAQLKKLGITEDSLMGILAKNYNTGNKASMAAFENVVAAREAAAAAKEGQGIYGAMKAGYSALRATPWLKALRREDGGEEMGYYQEGGDPDSMLENIGEFLDPTGMSSYDDVYRTFQNPESAWYDKGLAIAGALPIVGKFGKAAKVVGELSKAQKAARIAGRVLTPVAQMDKYVNPASRFVAGATGKALENAPKVVKGAASFGTMSNQANRFFTGTDMLMGYPGKEYGGEMDEMAYGGQMGFGLDLNSRRVNTDMAKPDSESVGNTLAPVDREDATYEAEKNEVLVGDMDKDGQNEMLTFGGKRHSQGGTPANKPGFIFSDTRGMRMKGPIVEEFGKKAGQQYTPAQLAKQYDLNKYKTIVDDPNADPVTKRTAEIMMENYEKKLGKLAMVQESMKGFPQGIPEIAARAFPELAEQMQGGQQQPMDMAEAAYGGYYAYGGIPQMQTAGTTPGKLPDWYQFFTKANTPKGGISRTGKPTTYNPQDGNKAYDDLSYWQRQAGRDFTSRKDMQEYVFKKLIQENPSSVRDMTKEYGYPAGHTLADGIFGARSADAFSRRMVEKITPQPQKPVVVPSKPAIPTEVKPIPQEEEVQPTRQPQQPYLPYNALDKANLLEAISRPVKSYGPRAFIPDIQEMQGYYDQPDYNPLLSAANTRMQMNNTFGNTGAAMAANSYNPELTQGILAETNRARANNLQTANQISSSNTEIRNRSNLMNAQLMQDNYDKWIKTQEETDIANKLKVRKDIIPAAGQMLNNRAEMQAKNMMYPEYAVTGNFWDQMPFYKGYRVGSGEGPSATPGSREEFYSRYPSYKAAYESGDLKQKMEVDKAYMQHLQQTRQAMSRNPRNYMGNMQGATRGMFMDDDPNNPFR